MRAILVAIAVSTTLCSAQDRQQNLFLSRLHAATGSPVFTTYAAAGARSEFTLDKGYHLTFSDPIHGVDFTNASGGDLCLAFEEGGRIVRRVSDMASPPVITASYPDLVRCTFSPFDSIKVELTFLVYGSHDALEELDLKNVGSQDSHVQILPFLRKSGSAFDSVEFHRAENALTCIHVETPDQWVRDHEIPFVGFVRDVFTASEPPDRVISCDSSDALAAIAAGRAAAAPFVSGHHLIAMSVGLDLRPGQLRRLIISRSVGRPGENLHTMIDRGRGMATLKLDSLLRADERVFAHMVPLRSSDPDRQMLYWSACNLLAQVLLPPEGECHYNYYVFSREPQWGWGHGGQVFHESLAMLAFAYVDPTGAMNSQRVFAERQHPDGYINYRTGPYLDEQIPYKGQLTSSGPFYAWENWEIYRITRDTSFLREMYASSSRFYDFWLKNRDADGDGLCEWGGQAVLESLRDGDVAVWDQVGWPSQFEALDLNCMLVKEARSLASMAGALGDERGAERWREEAQRRSRLVNRYMWDRSSEFYYHVTTKDHSFSSKNPNDLKRQEVIGFLPLWAGVAEKRQAQALVRTLTNPRKFWREYGIPSLAADDPYYNPRGYWNGPVWVQWNYLIVRGLLDYGYIREAREIANRVAANMIAMLRQTNTFWELYSPDSHWAGHHQTYIWAGLINRMMIDVGTGGRRDSAAIGHGSFAH